MYRRLLVLACALLISIPAPAVASGVTQSSALVGVQQVLYRGGTNGYGCFRIPVLSRTSAGTLLAFAEARKSPSCADRGDIDLVVRRSTNDGRTWGPIRVVTSGSPTDPDAPFTRGNAVPVVDRETGKINLITTSNEATPTGKRVPWIQQSSDDGLTWTAPRPLGASFDGTNNGWFATGPAHGIQLTKDGPYKGRLIVGAHQKPNSTTVLAGVLYSDDHGETWNASQVPNSFVAGQLSPGEIAVAELPNGNLYAAARNEVDDAPHRAKAVSTDGGTTMPAFSTVPSLASPNVQGSVLPLQQTYRTTPGDVLIFSGPSDPNNREELKIRYSTDGGTTWAGASNGLVTNERSGYSDLAELTGGEIGVVYEGGVTFSADEIRFTRFTPTQLGLPGTTRGTPSPQPSVPAGLTTPDSTAEANDAYLRGNATLNDGLLLDGTGDYADIPYTRTLDPGADDFTISTRFRYSATETSADQVLFWGYGTGSAIPQVWLRVRPGSDEVAAWVQGQGGHAYLTMNAVRAFGDGMWHQLTLTRTGSRVDLTIDDVTATGTGVVGPVSTGVTGLRLGAKQDATASDAFAGRLGNFSLVRNGVPRVNLAFKTVDGASVPARAVAPVTDDVSGHCATGRLLGGKQTPVPGRATNTVALPVNSAHPGVETPFSPTLDLGAGDFTFAVWFKYSGSAEQAIVWAYGTTSGKRSLWVRAQPEHDQLFAWVETGTDRVSLHLADNSNQVAFGGDRWHLLALTRSGERVELSVDGGEPAVATGLTGSVSADQADAIKGLRLGSKMDGSNVMQGAVDDFRLYHRALTSAELAQAATGRFPADLANLWWTFENQNTQAHDVVQPITGPQTSDASVHCAHAAVSGTPAVVTGKIGNAVRFDGADDAVYMPYKPSIALGDKDFKVSTWLRYAGSGDQVVFWAYGMGATERGLWMRGQPTQNRLLVYMQTDTGAFQAATQSAFNDDDWHFVEVERKAGTLTVSVDGIQSGSVTVSGSVTYGDTFAVDGFRLGAKPDGTNRLIGTLDEFQIHRGAALAAHLPLNAAS
ncbi:exo-alpha-sialidase [Kibdelosporangium philippinense]|uniref:exo-alpha-sialidase n=1 Tax=Kibdelosporangium philippinense TaxID=211113 RepID=A0ABS8ZTV1_9PSEU|nr:LamG-like jellyroll fold domain-containing protein [Kibdelosporangium philippinense]MCE7011136.1 exo-alpha-sialidase [Kibdelosporangium philippinense]